MVKKTIVNIINYKCFLLKEKLLFCKLLIFLLIIFPILIVFFLIKFINVLIKIKNFFCNFKYLLKICKFIF